MNTPDPTASETASDSPPSKTTAWSAQLVDEDVGLDETVEVSLTRTPPLTPTPSVVGYQIIEQIGSGAMGLVYRAKQESLDRFVAIKTIRPSMTSDSDTLRRFEQEAIAIAQLAHPNIVSAHDFGKTNDDVFLVMELIDGQDLAQWIDSHSPVSERVAWSIARQLASGLLHANRHGVTHRDVKPANVIVLDSSDGYELPPGVPMVKLTDFGLALLSKQQEVQSDEASEAKRSAKSAFGSPAYMAPELFAGVDPSAQTDIYSLGMTVFHLLTGAPPMDGESVSSAIRLKLAGDRPELRNHRPDISDSSSALFERMTAPTNEPSAPEQRISNYEDLLKAITSICKEVGEVPRRRRGSQFGVPAKPFMAIVGILIVLAGSFTYWLRNAGPSPKTLVPTGVSAMLFDGQGLDFGTWSLGDSSGGWSVQHGELVHSLNADHPYLVGRSPQWQHFVVMLNARLTPDAVARVHFQIMGSHDESKRAVIQLSNDDAILGHSLTDSSKCDRVGDPMRLSSDRETHYVKLERQPKDWWIYVNDKLLGTLPVDVTASNSDFAVSVLNGSAAFSEISARQLAPESSPTDR